MEVCILGVLTVNLLTFCSQSAPLSSEMRSSPMLVKDGWLSLDRKSSNALLQPVLRAYMMTRERHK